MTSHGFGHGTRACAVIHALNQRNRSRFMIFSSLPDWFWSENLGEIEHQCIHAETDIGLIQKSPFHHDLDLTAKAWMSFISFSNENFDRCLHRVNQFEPECILCDISPLGLWVGQKLGIPSILIENFTWDWMLEIYAEKNPLFQTISQQLFDLYQRFDLRLQATPFCQKSEYGITVNPIYRNQVETESEVRKQLQVPASTPLIMITTGGICHQYEFLDALYGHSDQNFLLTGNYKSIRCEENIIFLPMQPIPLSGSRLHIRCGHWESGIWNFSGIMGERHTLTRSVPKGFQGIFQIERIFKEKYAFGRDDPEGIRIRLLVE